MTISTIAVWNPLCSQADLVAIQTKAAQMATEGKTDNVPVFNDPPHPPKITTRTWTTLADAEEWIAFVANYSPASHTIQQT